MRRIGNTGRCLLAAFALGALVTANASASALRPEYMMCEKAPKLAKRYTGGYDNKQCTEVNAAGEGRYTTSAVVTPYPFEARSRASTIYYYGEHGEGVLWEVQCKKGLDRGVITSPTTGTLSITLESCAATNELTGEKPAKCLAGLTATLESRTEATYPGEQPAVVLTPGFTKAFACGPDTFGRDSGYEIGEVQSAGKGPASVFAVDRATGEQEIRQFYWFEGNEAEDAFLYSTVNGSPLDVGLEATEALGPNKEVVVVA